MATNKEVGRPTRYDFDRRFRMRRFSMRRGRDYTTSQSSMAQQIRAAASRRKLSVTVVDTEDGFDVTVYPFGKAPLGPHKKRNR